MYGRHFDAPSYTGTHAFVPMGVPHGHGGPHHGYPGFCHSCGHPRAKCCCGCRECRKEAKELLVKPDLGAEHLNSAAGKDAWARAAMMRQAASFFATAGGVTTLGVAPQGTVANVGAAARGFGQGTAFIGGGCCVHLSVEYAPTTPTAPSGVLVLVDDSEGTAMAWGKLEPAGTTYKVKEGIITTKPGADVTVLAVNMTVRLRWCEVFSC